MIGFPGVPSGGDINGGGGWGISFPGLVQGSMEWVVMLLVKRILEGVHFNMGVIPVAIPILPSQ